MRIALSGTGLIGASFGLALCELGHDVSAWDPDPEHLRIAYDAGAADTLVDDLDALLASNPDVVVLAGPPSAVVAALRDLATDAVVMDVAGVKLPVLEAAPAGLRFVGTHPMAGRETSGPEAASPALFRGAAWVVCPDGAHASDESDVALVEQLIESVGGRPLRMGAAEHDEAVAAISHGPQLLAGSLVHHAVDTGSSLDLAAGSFRDLTRVAASDPELWLDVLDTNRGAVLDTIAALQRRLAELAEAIESRDKAGLEAFLATAQSTRRSLTARAAAVRVALADQPGELAKVGRALAGSAVDVRDIQLRHAPHGGGGVLTISVRPGDAQNLEAALEAEGLLLTE
jgi:prephenate dehydrogenase